MAFLSGLYEDSVRFEESRFWAMKTRNLAPSQSVYASFYDLFPFSCDFRRERGDDSLQLLSDWERSFRVNGIARAPGATAARPAVVFRGTRSFHFAASPLCV